MPYIIIGFLVIMIPLSSYLFFKRGKKKGMDDFLALLIKSGYDAKVKSFKTQNKIVKKGGIVFVGDSITQDFNVYEYFPDFLVYNRGIGGDTTKGLLERLDVSIFELEPKAVVLLMGTNDFAVLNDDIETIYDRMKEVCKTISMRLPNAKIYLESIYPVNPKMDIMSVGNRKNQHIEKLNELYQTIPNIIYVDLYHALLDENHLLHPKYTVEGLHINHEGYQLISSILKTFIKNETSK